MLTVRDLLRDLDVRLLAGERSLHLPVRWVHISELLDPTPWLAGGELLLTTGMQLDTPAQQREFMTRLADHHLAGLGFGTGFKHAAVPPPLLEVAAERELPVVEVPYEVPFIAVTEAAFTQLVNEQYAVLRRALAAQERLERIVLSERGLDALVGALSTLIGAAVVVFDSRGEPLQQHEFRRAIEPEALDTLRGEVRERARRLGPFGLGERVAATVLRRSDSGNGPGSRPGAGSGSGSGSVEAALWSALRDEASPALVASVGPLACALVPGGADEELFALGERLLTAAEGELQDHHVRVGIGRTVPAPIAQRSLHEARWALESMAFGLHGS